MANQKILLLVEGEKADVEIMKRLLTVYELSVDYEIISYRTNIHQLYSDLFESDDPSDFDLLQLLKSRESDPEKHPIFDQRYSDIYLVFDLDPQDPRFDPYKLMQMANYFRESSDMGKLYINYPMVESFYHMKSIPDPEYNERTVSMDELYKKAYKKRVRNETCYRNYAHFAMDRQSCSEVIKQNLAKANLMTNSSSDLPAPLQSPILEAQLALIQQHSHVSVLSTCCFFIPEYQPSLLL